MITWGQEKAYELLKSLSAFNKLDRSTVHIIGQTFELDAFKICRDNGITYFINKPVETTNEQPRFTSAEYHVICNAVSKCHGDKDEVFQINAKMNKLVKD